MIALCAGYRCGEWGPKRGKNGENERADVLKNSAGRQVG